MKKLSVPLLKQTKLSCGVTALRMVLQYFGKNISSKEIVKRIGGIKKYGVRTIKLADFARSLGFKVECYSYNGKRAKDKARIKKPSKADIIKFLRKKLPVILAVNSFALHNKGLLGMGHFIVITKYEKGRFWYNNPLDGRPHIIKEEDLLFAWHNNILDSSAYLLVLKPRTQSKTVVLYLLFKSF